MVLKTGWPRPTPTSNAGVVGHTYAADTIVGHRRHLSRTPRAMPAGVKSTALAVDRAWRGGLRSRRGHTPLHLSLLSHLCTDTPATHTQTLSTPTRASLSAPARPGLWKRLQPLGRGSSAFLVEMKRETEARDRFLPVVIHLRVPGLGVRVLIIDIEAGPRILEGRWPS